jgi:O-antigen/teichoic acid export membrane protein
VVAINSPSVHTQSGRLRSLDLKIQGTQVKVAEKSAESLGTRLLQRFLGIDRSVTLKKLIPWVSKGGLAILDQGLVSGSNFLVSVLLARWLAPGQYGAYAIAFGIQVLLTVVYQALVLEPMSVYGGSSYRNGLRGYLGSLLWVHAALSLAICIALGTSAITARGIAHSEGLAGALAGVTIASPFALAFGMARRGFYLELSPAKAALGAFVYSSFSVTGLYLLYHRGLLSAFSAFLLMGLAAFATTLYLFLRLRKELRPSSVPAPSVRETWKRHWGYGRWALAGSIAGWIPAYIYYPVLTGFGNIVHSGQLKALMNLTQPMEQTKAALAMLLLPYAAGVHDREGRSSASSLAKRMTLVSLGGAMAYWAVILPFNRPVFQLMYSGRYMEVAHLLPIVAFGSIVWSAAYGPAIALRAMESPASVFVAFSSATGLSLLVGIPAAWRYGLSGAIWGSNLADVLSLVIVLLVLRCKIASHSDDQASVGMRNGTRTDTLAEGVAAE